MRFTVQSFMNMLVKRGVDVSAATTIAEAYDILDLHVDFTARYKTAAGACYFDRRTGLACRITLNLMLATLDAKDLAETFFHELAHAALPGGTGHNNQWRTLARRMGCSGDRCHTHDFS